jgi:predicted RNA-binding protein with RPS1 domain
MQTKKFWSSLSVPFAVDATHVVHISALQRGFIKSIGS